MYCPQCGKEHEEGAAFCPYCGKKLDAAPIPETKAEITELDEPPAASPAPATETKPHKCVIALVGFCLAFEIPLAGLICSIIGYKRCIARGESWKEFALAGIIISAILLAISVIAVILEFAYMSIFFAYLSEIFGEIIQNSTYSFY